MFFPRQPVSPSSRGVSTSRLLSTQDSSLRGRCFPLRDCPAVLSHLESDPTQSSPLRAVCSHVLHSACRRRQRP
ncbi:hypothetical protein EXE43_20965 [Halorubrum sp. SS5]|nr:hypothetical protein EXE43_20965 [Halorubrum sp. SS5]